MKKVMTIVLVLCAFGCSKKEETEQLPVSDTTTPTTELAKVVEVDNTPAPDYAAYRKKWKRVNSNPTDGYRLVDGRIEKDIVEIQLDDLPFKEAFRFQYLGKGEGRTFWWRGREYTTNLLDVIAEPVEVEDLHEVEDLLEGGGDQGTPGN